MLPLTYQVFPGPCHIPCLPVGVALRKAHALPGVFNTLAAPPAELTDERPPCQHMGWTGPTEDLLS